MDRLIAEAFIELQSIRLKHGQKSCAAKIAQAHILRIFI